MKKLVILLPLLLVACGGSIKVNSSLKPEAFPNQRDGQSRVWRYHDDEEHTTCWLVTQYSDGSGAVGISCLRDK